MSTNRLNASLQAFPTNHPALASLAALALVLDAVWVACVPIPAHAPAQAVGPLVGFSLATILPVAIWLTNGLDQRDAATK